MFKGTSLYSIFTNTCPKCQEGKFFKTSNPYDLKNFDEINDNCKYCGESFTREPGFYIGSMYVSYALSVALTVTVFILFVLILDIDIYPVLYGLIPAFLLLLPIFFRTARIIWLNIFVSFDLEKSRASHRKKQNDN